MLRLSRSPAIAASSLALVLLVCGPLSAAFHIMKISELLVGSGGDCRIQYVELQMRAGGQNRVGNHPLFFFDAAGNEVGSFMIPDDVSSGDNADFILIGTQAFADASGVTPDFIMPRGLLMPHGGRVSFDARPASGAVDSLAYGIYSGDNTGHGAPAAALSVLGEQSLTRVSDTGNDSADFELQDPSPTNNAGETGAITPPAPECWVVDDFEDLSNWDIPAANEGLDLEPCVGAAVVADIGSATVENGAMILSPGETDDIDLGVPICFLTLNNEVAQRFADEPGYRVKFDFVAREGIVTAASFLHQHNGFDEELELLDISTAAGLGINYGFDDITETTDHVHPDVRLQCLQEGFADGPGDADYTSAMIEKQNLRSSRKHTVILDTEGDDVEGPLRLSAKLFDSSLPEPDYIGTWFMEFGLGGDPDPALDRGVLLAALGQPGSAMEITNFSVCELPRSAQAIKNVVCERQFDDSITITWENPVASTAEDAAAPIALVVNDVEIDRLDGDETSYDLVDAPLDDAVIQLINYSCVPAVCSICFNDDPEPEISGPTTVVLPEDGPVSVELDSRGSDDAEDGGAGLVRAWAVIAKPAGSSAEFDDFGAEVVRFTVDMPGEYTVELSVTDNGCTGDGFDLKVASAMHTITVSESMPDEIFRRADANASGGFPDLSDGISILNFLFLQGFDPPTCPDAADSNDSGGVDLSDGVFIFNFLFNAGVTPPAPGPNDCGPDATEDDLGPCVYEGC